MKKFLLLAVVCLFLSCLSDDNGSIEPMTLVINFTHHWDEAPVTEADFGALAYVNENGETLSIERLRYLISNITLHGDAGPLPLQGYKLVDLEGGTDGLQAAIDHTYFPPGSYTALSFTFGFDEADNAQNYPDLNTAGWSWPENLGGGYHFMQFEGFYETAEDPAPYALHMGTARVGEGAFEPNHFTVEMETPFTVSDHTELDMQMNIAEWFRTPHTWDLNEYSTDLMMNYDAQVMLRENGESVFDLEAVNP